MEFHINNTFVFGLDNALRASGNPFRVRIDQVGAVDQEKANKRAYKLSQTEVGEGHDQFMTGIIVQFDLHAPLYMWKEIQRYHFLDFVSLNNGRL